METQQENHTLSSIQDRFVNTAQYTISYQKQIFFKILILYLLLTFGVLFFILIFVHCFGRNITF